MTYSDAWIDTIDDGAFAAFLKESRTHDLPLEDRIFLLPRPPRPGTYWINIVREWAIEQGLSVQYVDPLELRVSVSRTQLAKFIDDTFGMEPAGKVVKLRAHVREHFRDDRAYVIVADEF